MLVKYGYQVNEQGEVANVANTFNESVAADQVNKDVAALKKLADYSHQLEREGLKVDLNANTTGNSSSNTVPTPNKPKGHK